MDGEIWYYEPGFVVVTDDGASHIVETKDLEDVNVANKDRAARLWCENKSKPYQDLQQLSITTVRDLSTSNLRQCGLRPVAQRIPLG